MARPELEALRETDSLAEALEDRSHVVGFTARSGFRRDPVPLADLPAIAAEWGAEARPALLFGPEDCGLETADCDRCTVLVRIPTPGLSSLNLSHAVTVALYEWFRGEVALPPVEVGPAREGEGRFADVEAKIRLARKTSEALQAAVFREPTEEVAGTLRRVLAQPMERRDLRMLERILRHVEWLAEQKSGSRPTRWPE
jgi:tRNA/rRNA methyltransferase